MYIRVYVCLDEFGIDANHKKIKWESDEIWRNMSRCSHTNRVYVYIYTRKQHMNDLHTFFCSSGIDLLAQMRNVSNVINFFLYHLCATHSLCVYYIK